MMVCCYLSRMQAALRRTRAEKLTTASHTELPVNPGDVGVHGPYTDLQLLSDLLVRPPVGKAPEDVDLATREAYLRASPIEEAVPSKRPRPERSEMDRVAYLLQRGVAGHAPDAHAEKQRYVGWPRVAAEHKQPDRRPRRPQAHKRRPLRPVIYDDHVRGAVGWQVIEREALAGEHLEAGVRSQQRLEAARDDWVQRPERDSKAAAISVEDGRLHPPKRT
jgi:hypothetical protein